MSETKKMFVKRYVRVMKYKFSTVDLFRNPQQHAHITNIFLLNQCLDTQTMPSAHWWVPLM